MCERQARSALQQIYDAAVGAAQPPLLLERHVKVSANALVIETDTYRGRFPLAGKVYVVGVGKGADLAAPAWEKLFNKRLEHGIFIVRDTILRDRPERVTILSAGHPLPDYRGLMATQRCLRMLRGAGRDDYVICFLMGGASSLLVQPADGITLADKQATTAALLKCGMSIAETNCVRKHLSRVKAGGLLRAAYPARVITLAISDVIGDDPAAIGSAPSFHDPTTFEEACKILEKYRLMNGIPKSVKSHLLRGVRGEIPETLKPGSILSNHSPFIMLANNRGSLAAARSRAESLGFDATVVTAELSGDAATRARQVCSKLKSIQSAKKMRRRPACLLLGGETTVRVTGNGLGGRNQEFALASAIELRGRRGLYLLSAASDGSDGPTDAAGAFVDGDTFSRAGSLGLNPDHSLRDNDSYNFFKRSGDLFCPGPTGTNVLDFVIALLY